MSERIICVCCNLTAIVIFHDKSALCLDHARVYQTILEHESLDISIRVMEK